MLISANVMAGDSQDQVSSKAKALVNKVAGSSKVAIQNSFKSIGNLDGFVIGKKGDDSGRKALLYVDNQGRYIVSGQIISAQGKNITQQDHEQYITAKKAPKLIKQAKQTNYFEQGKDDAPHKAYILIEPNCIACHDLYQDIHSYIDEGKLAVRWIPVAFRKADSTGKAAAIMTSDNPGKALAKNEEGFDKKSESGGIKPMDDVPANIKKQIESNKHFMMNNGIHVTPVMMYQDSSGKAHVKRGSPGKKALKNIVDNMNSDF